MENKKTLRPFGMRDKIGYAFGDLGCGLSFSLVSTYMFLFYTECVGLSLENWGWIVFVAKVWDAINDVLIGNMIDRKRISQKSKFMPWIIIGAVGLVATTVMIFAPVQSFTQGKKAAWCLASYCLWSVAYTLVNVPYGSLHTVIPENQRERTALSTFRSVGAGVAMVLVMILPKIVYVRNEAEGGPEDHLKGDRIFVVSIVFSLLALVFLVALTKMVTERVPYGKTAEKVNYISTLKSFFTNRPMIGATLATFFSVAFYNSSMSVNNLVFQHYFNDAKKTTIAMFASYLPLVLFMPFAGKLVAAIGKKKLITLSGLLSAIGGILMLVLPITPDSKGMYIYIGGLMIVNIGNCLFQIIVWAIIVDCIEISVRKRGVHEEGSLYAVYSFFRKLAQGVGSSLIAFALARIGYVTGRNAVQPPEFCSNVKNLYIILLLIGTVGMVLAMQFIYNIDKKKENALGDLIQENSEID